MLSYFSTGDKESHEITLDESLRVADVLDTIRSQLGVVR